MDPYNHRYKRGEFSVTWHNNGELAEERGHITDLIAAQRQQDNTSARPDVHSPMMP